MALSQAQNRRLTEVGPGTPMGELLRRYWQPVGAEDQFDTEAKRSIRILGEDLVLYRMPSGEYGLTERHCPHRRADFIYGYVEDDGIRCSYHGWKFDPSGQCVEQPYDDLISSSNRFRQQTCAKAYPAKAAHGLVWVYLGPDPAPLIPNWEPFTVPNTYKQIMFHVVDCNWLQCQENSCDPVHFEWLHDNWTVGTGAPDGTADTDGYGPPHVELGFEEWEHGFMYRRLKPGEDETTDSWINGRLAIHPNLFAPVHFEWRVPIDDEQTLSVIWVAEPVVEHRVPFEQQTIHSWHGVTHDDEGRALTSHVLHQDSLSWVGQGVIADRTRERLGRSDRGVQMIRNRLEADMAAVERGEEPSGVIRDPAANECIEWPSAVIDSIRGPVTPELVDLKSKGLHRLLPGLPADDDFFLIAGQPEHVRAEWLYAMGISDEIPPGLTETS
ncbi:MAG: Rieske 2Fe-2S domain-containing protein [Acidimicrobiales bacterium]